MGNTSNDRVLALLKTRKMDVTDAARLTEKPYMTIKRIVDKESTPTKTTLKVIAERLGCDYTWLLTGRGEMKLTAELPVETVGQGTFNPALDTLYKEMKDEIEFYKEIIRNLTGKANFLRVLNASGTTREAQVVSLRTASK